MRLFCHLATRIAPAELTQIGHPTAQEHRCPVDADGVQPLANRLAAADEIRMSFCLPQVPFDRVINRAGRRGNDRL